MDTSQPPPAPSVAFLFTRTWPLRERTRTRKNGAAPRRSCLYPARLSRFNAPGKSHSLSLSLFLFYRLLCSLHSKSWNSQTLHSRILWCPSFLCQRLRQVRFLVPFSSLGRNLGRRVLAIFDILNLDLWVLWLIERAWFKLRNYFISLANVNWRVEDAWGIVATGSSSLWPRPTERLKAGLPASCPACRLPE